jgi:hypothetical protein
MPVAGFARELLDGPRRASRFNDILVIRGEQPITFSVDR